MYAGALAPDLSLSMLTATSVSVSWTQPMFSFDVQSYEVLLTRLTLCDTITDRRGPRTISANAVMELFEDLEEFITYRASVTANFQLTPFSVSPATDVMEFTTQGVGTSLLL